MKNGEKTNKWGVNFHFGVEIKADKGEKESSHVKIWSIKKIIQRAFFLVLYEA